MRNRIVTAIKQRFSIRKLSIGAASVLLGTSLYFMGPSAPVVHAATTGAPASPEKEKTGTNDPVVVAGDSTKNDADVNNAIDKYAQGKQEKLQGDHAPLIRPSDTQSVTVYTPGDRAYQVGKIRDKIDSDIKQANEQANKDKESIEKYKNDHPETLKNGEDSDFFKNQGLSVGDEKNSEINQITVDHNNQDKGNTLSKGQSETIDGIHITHADTDKMTYKEQNVMKINSDNKVIVDFQRNQCSGKEITVTYDNLKNSYYLENIDDKINKINKINKIKISKIKRTFSHIQEADKILFTPDGKTPKGADGVYDKCDGPQLIIYNDPSDGFFYNNIKQVSVNDIYYDDKGSQINFDTKNDKNKAWIFVTSLNSNGGGNVEKVRAQGLNNSPVNAEKIKGSTVTVTNHNDGWWYSDNNNWFGKNLDWDNNAEDNRFGFVGTVAFQYQPGMTLQYWADDSQWESHWASMQTQVVSSLNQHVIIYDHIKDGVIPVDPEHKDSRVDPKNYTKDVKETIHYKGAGDKTPADHVQNSVWTRTITVDAVTGDIVDDGAYDTAWAIKPGEKSEYDEVATQPIAGYHADQKSVAKTAVTQNDLEYTVTYTENGHIIPVYPDGTPIPNVPNPQYPTDPDDPTKVTPKDVPEIPGYTPKVPTVTPNDPGNDTEVVYHKDIKDVTTVVHYVDKDNVNKVILSSGNLTGKEGTQIGYSSKQDLKTLTDEGYVLDKNGYDPDGKIPNFDSKVSVYEITLKHGTTTVTPDNPGHPGQPVDPDNPDGPKYPDGTELEQVKRTGTQIIHYTGAGDKTPADNKQTFVFTREITFDDVTGKIISVTPWNNVQSHTFGNVDTPVIPGYHADKAVAGGETVTPDDLNKVITVTYAPDGNPGNPSDHGDTPSPEPTPEPEPTPNPTPDDQPDSETSSDEHFEKAEAKDKLDKTNPKKVDAYKKQRKIIKTKIAKQGHTGIEEPIEDKVTRENNVKAVSDPVENTAAEPKLPQTGEADNSIIGLLGMLLASFAAMFGFDSLHSHDKKHKN